MYGQKSGARLSWKLRSGILAAPMLAPTMLDAGIQQGILSQAPA
jgi:hypothetical protein